MSPPPCAKCAAPARVHMADSPRCHACLADYLHRTFKAATGRLRAGGRRTLVLGLSGRESSAAAALLLRAYHAAVAPHPREPPPHMHVVHVAHPGPAAPPPPVLAALQARLAGCDAASFHVARVPDATAAAVAAVTDRADRAALARRAVLRALARRAAELSGSGGGGGDAVVVLGSSATRAAADVLGALAAGRPAGVPDGARGDAEVDGVRFVRPLGGVPRRLLVRFARAGLGHDVFDGAPALDGSYGGGGGPAADSTIDAIVARFVAEVADDNASSVHNVVRVGQRLLPNSGPRCEACGAAAERVACTKEEGETQKLVTGEEELQRNGCDLTHPTESVQSNRGAVVDRLCLGCKGCAERAGLDSEDNPVLRLAELSIEKGRTERKLTVEEMRNSISEFLL